MKEIRWSIFNGSINVPPIKRTIMVIGVVEMMAFVTLIPISFAA